MTTHRKQAHGGYAAAALRRGEQWAMCSVCGQRAHPRLFIRQAIHVTPRQAVWPRYAAAVAAIVAALGIIAQAGPA